MGIKNKLFYCVIFLVVIISDLAYGREVGYLSLIETGTHDEGRNDEREIEACKVFKPTKKQIMRFFNLAKESKESGPIFHAYYSPCLATGLIKFKDGASGSWVLQSSGFGYVTFRNNETTYFFHKDNKWTDPYACTYGLGDDPVC